ncbi:MAG: hypothetical protein KJ749_10740, partial [Planctomycetes bacterium]|nr:hypothetical protein [Planctomycetota bacterium]
MNQAACQSVADSADWVWLDEAVTLTGKPERTWCRWAAREVERATREGRKPLAHKVPDGKRKPRWQLHRVLDHRLTRFPDSTSRDERAEPALYAKYPKHVVDRAYRKAHWLQRWRDRCHAEPTKCARILAGEVVAEAKRNEDADFAISVRALQRWQRAYYAKNPSGQIRAVEGLIDGRGVSAIGTTPDSVSKRHPQAVDYFYGLYHSQAGHTVKTCHEATLREARRQGWAWPAGYAATTRWVREYDQKDATCLHRDGPTKYSKKYLPHIERDWT